MRILLLTHYFEPENGAPQRRWTALIERFADAGHDVVVIAPPPHYPTGTSDRDLPRVLRAGGHGRGAHGGYVYRVGFLPHNSNVVSRTLDHAWVARNTVKLAARLARRGRIAPDVVIATAPGLPTLVAGRIVATKLDVPLIAEMRDAWPDLVSHTPGLGSARGVRARIKRYVHEAVTALQRGAALVVTTTDSFARVLSARGVERVHVIRNGTVAARYSSIPATDHDHIELRVLYMGTVGRSQGLEHIVHAAAIAKSNGARLVVRIVGYGADLKRLKALNRSLGEPVELLGRVAANEVHGHYAWADTTVVSLRDWEPFEWTVPSKLYELMAIGKHITAVVSGEAADLVRRTGAGDVVQPGDAIALAGLWERLSSHRRLASSRDGGSAWARANVDYDVIARQYLQLIEDAIGA